MDLLHPLRVGQSSRILRVIQLLPSCEGSLNQEEKTMEEYIIYIYNVKAKTENFSEAIFLAAQLAKKHWNTVLIDQVIDDEVNTTYFTSYSGNIYSYGGYCIEHVNP